MKPVTHCRKCGESLPEHFVRYGSRFCTPCRHSIYCLTTPKPCKYCQSPMFGEYMGKSARVCRQCYEKRRAYAYQAHKVVANAVRRGEIPRPASFACADCGGAAREYDHRDYRKPLEVDAVCRRCNLRRGPAKDIAEHMAA